jgi:hypothetical protein
MPVNQIIVRDITGRIVFRDDRTFEGTKKVRIDAWDNGIYFVEVNSRGYRVNRKIIKQ